MPPIPRRTSPLAVPAAQHRFPRHRRSAGRARAALRQQLTDWKVPNEAAETAVLLLSELVANAVEHGKTSPGREIEARYELRGGVLRVEVADAGDGLPRPRPAAADDEDGRGLALVAAFSERWGTSFRRDGVGKTVWAELEVPEPGAPAAPPRDRQ
ncbi:ATP-binding protein [Streptomyces varsoviensis]|uniref:ATP-binding protein n=1 Tax=Streptomyces varsoviensis TaxID=67373 RepID=UPI003403F1AC